MPTYYVTFSVPTLDLTGDFDFLSTGPITGRACVDEMKRVVRDGLVKMDKPHDVDVKITNWIRYEEPESAASFLPPEPAG